jgi:hypothetical protein
MTVRAFDHADWASRSAESAHPETSRASGNDMAGRSSFVTTRVTPAWQAPTPAAARPIPIRAGQSVVEVDAVITDTERSKAVALRGESSVLR